MNDNVDNILPTISDKFIEDNKDKIVQIDNIEIVFGEKFIQDFGEIADKLLKSKC